MLPLKVLHKQITQYSLLESQLTMPFTFKSERWRFHELLMVQDCRRKINPKFSVMSMILAYI